MLICMSVNTLNIRYKMKIRNKFKLAPIVDKIKRII